MNGQKMKWKLRVRGKEDARLYSHFGSDDHHIYDQIQKVLVKVITIVMNYEE